MGGNRVDERVSERGNGGLPSSIADTFGRKATLAIGVSAVGFAVSFVGSVVVARLLGAGGKGTFSLFLATVSGLTTFAGFGISQGQMYHASKDSTKLDRMMPNGVVVSLLFGGGAVLLYFLLGYTADFQITSLGSFGAISAVLLVPTLSILKFQKQYLTTTHHYALSRANMAINQALPLLSVIVLYPFVEITVDALIIAVTGGALALLVSYHCLMRRVLDSHVSLSPRHFSLPFAKESLWFGIRQYLSELTLFLTNRLDFFLVAWLIGRPALGVYSVAVALAEVVLRVPRELGLILFPVFASESLRKGQAASFLRRMNVIALITAVGLGLAAEHLILVLFGSEFREASAVFRWLLPGTIAWSTIQVTWSRVSAGGRPGLGSPIFGAAALINAGLNIVLLPRIGVVGAAYAATVSYLLAATVFLILFCRREGCGLREVVLIRREDVQSIIRTAAMLVRRPRA